MLSRKIPFYFLIITFLISGFFFYFIQHFLLSNKSISDNDILNSDPAQCKINLHRLPGYKFVRPLLYTDPQCESPELNQIKMEVNNIISNHKAAGNVLSASFYLRVVSQAQWTSSNDFEKYSPGSLLKVPELIAFYRMNERAPGLMDRKIKYEEVQQDTRQINFNSKHIEVGKEYSIRELLKYMIVYSDNQATILLNNIIDKEVFNSVFTDVGLEKPDYSSNDYPMNVKDYTIFLIELYNGTCLSFKDSEDCLKLLSEAEFKDGMLKTLPDGIAVAHKFGEAGPTSEPHFSESAIIYAGNNCYILTVMTKGKDIKKLPLVVSEISQKIYNSIMTRG